MNAPVYVYDPTATDEKSKVRGVGRYMQTMYEYLGTDFTFTKNVDSVPHTHIFINPFFNHLQKPLKLGRIGKRQIAVIHDLIPFKYPKAFPIGLKGKLMRLLNNWSLKKYDFIVTDSEASKKDIVQILKIPDKRVRVIYATVPQTYLPHLDTTQEHHPFHKEQNATVAEFSNMDIHQFASKNLQNLHDFVLYVGDGTWNKNLINLAKAVQLANVTCVCVGKVFNPDNPQSKAEIAHPWQHSLQVFLKIAKADKRFIFPGFISDIDLLSLYKKAKVNILPSFDEGFGLSYIEAGYMSTPSVLADIPVFREIARNGAHFANPNDPRDIAEKISQLYYDKILREKMSVQAFTRAQDFNPNKFRTNWLDLVNKLT